MIRNSLVEAPQKPARSGKGSGIVRREVFFDDYDYCLLVALSDACANKAQLDTDVQKAEMANIENSRVLQSHKFRTNVDVTVRAIVPVHADAERQRVGEH